MKSVLISIQPKWVEKILNGEKTIEVRKSRPKLETPFKCYIYCTYGQENENYMLGKRGKVIGDFVCDKIEEFHEYELSPSKKFYEFEKARLDLFLKESCLSYNEVCDYRKNLPYYKPLYGWHISDLKIYDKPKELSEFRKICPDKFHYCEICKYGSVVLSPDEEEYALYHSRNYDTYETVCHNIVTRQPQSWCYVEGLGE